MKRLSISLVIAIVLILVMSSVVMAGPPQDNVKVTGGGKIDDGLVAWTIYNEVTGPAGEYGEGQSKITFGFNVKPVGEPTLVSSDPFEDKYSQDAKGRLQLISHDIKFKMHGEFDHMKIRVPNDPLFPETVFYSGTCTLNGEPGIFIANSLYDGGEPGAINGDNILVVVHIGVPPEYTVYNFSGVVDGGNIQLHKK